MQRLAGMVAGALLVLSSPLVAHADPKPVTPPRPTPSDTAQRNDAAHRQAPARKKQVKARPSTTPPAGPDARQFIPDQPWETEFFVDNYVPGSHRGAPRLTLASVTRAP